MDENSKIKKCEDIIKKGELSKNENQLVLIYLLNKTKEHIETIKSLKNEIKILNDEKNVLNDQISQLVNIIKFNYLHNENQDGIINFNFLNDSEGTYDKYDKYKDFGYFNNFNNNNNKNFLKSSQKSNHYNNRIQNNYKNNDNSLRGSQISNYYN